MFNSEGNPTVEIIETTIAESKFGGAEAFDVCLKVKNVADENQQDWYRGEMSGNYCKGSMAHLTQMQATFETLGKLGFEGGQDLSRLPELVGVKTVAWIVKAEVGDKVYYNVRTLASSGGNAPEAIDMGLAASRMKAIMAGETTKSTDQSQTSEPTAASNPFLT